MVGRNRSDVSGIQAQQDSNATRHLAYQQFAMCKPNCDIILYNKTMTCDLRFISLYEDICVYARVGVLSRWWYHCHVYVEVYIFDFVPVWLYLGVFSVGVMS